MLSKNFFGFYLIRSLILLIVLILTFTSFSELVEAACHYYCANEVVPIGHDDYECDENFCGYAADWSLLGEPTANCRIGKGPISESCPYFGSGGFYAECGKTPCEGSNPCSCKDNVCPPKSDWDGYPCAVTKDCWGWSGCYPKDYYGRWSASTSECVKCDGKFKTDLFGDTGGLYVDCDGNTGTTMCTGTPHDCTHYEDQSLCEDAGDHPEADCEWKYGTCVGSNPKKCGYYFTQGKCENHGCEWKGKVCESACDPTVDDVCDDEPPVSHEIQKCSENNREWLCNNCDASEHTCEDDFTGCDAISECDELFPGSAIESCTKGGQSWFADECSSTCQGQDRGDKICRSSAFASDCTASPECNGKEAGKGGCTVECKYPEPCAPNCQTLQDKVSASFGYECGDAKYDKIADVNKDTTVDGKDSTLVSYYCYDDAWCLERLNNKTDPCVAEDITSPVTSIDPNSADTTEDVPFTLTCTDTDSGCSFVYYKIIDKTGSCPASKNEYTEVSGSTFSGTITCGEGEVCEKKVCYRSEDVAGNLEDPKESNVFKIDKTTPPPGEPCSKVGDYCKDGGDIIGFCVSKGYYDSHSGWFRELTGDYSCGSNYCCIACANNDCCWNLRGYCYSEDATAHTGCRSETDGSVNGYSYKCEEKGGEKCVEDTTSYNLIDPPTEPPYGPYKCVASIPIPGKPDLVIEDILQADNKVKYVIKNQGDAEAGPSASKLFVDGESKEIDSDVPSLGPNEWVDRTFDYDWKIPCTYPEDKIKVCADEYETVVEGNEDNNCKEVIWDCITGCHIEIDEASCVYDTVICSGEGKNLVAVTFTWTGGYYARAKIDGVSSSKYKIEGTYTHTACVNKEGEVPIGAEVRDSAGDILCVPPPDSPTEVSCPSIPTTTGITTTGETSTTGITTTGPPSGCTGTNTHDCSKSYEDCITDPCCEWVENYHSECRAKTCEEISLDDCESCGCSAGPPPPEVELICENLVNEHSEITKGEKNFCSIINCADGIWLVYDDKGKFLVKETIPPDIIDFTGEEEGIITTIAVCRPPTPDYKKHITYVVKGFSLTCPDECYKDQDCECEVTECNEGNLTLENEDGEPLYDKIIVPVDNILFNYTFKAKATGKVKAEAVCFDPIKYIGIIREESINILTGPTTTTTTAIEKEFEMSLDRCSESNEECEVEIEKNTVNDDLVILVWLFEEDDGIIYYTGKEKVNEGYTGEVEIDLDDEEKCPDDTELVFLALAYKESDEDYENPIGRIKNRAFTCG